MRLAPPLAIVLAACAGTPTDPPPAPGPGAATSWFDVVPPDDRHSYANPAEVQVRHVSLDLGVDFESRTIAGTATLRVHRRVKRAPLRLDSAGLLVTSVTAGGRELRWRREDADRVLGTSIRIELPPGVSEVVVEYETAPEAAALQWLEPEQTEGRAKPFLFTQGQPILTRSWIPLQDTPGVRITWEATIHVDPELGIVPVMSSMERQELGDGRFRFRMDLPVPSYLIALAVGELERRNISPRCAVWAEPGVVDRAAKDFADAERMIQLCERKYGPYRWSRQDMLVLPPAFPFGGMENPCLAFFTPTILTGDRELVSLLAHELAHAWSGNLVTNATWSDFWLNEGFTVYLEQRIVEELFGAERAKMEMVLGLRQLARELRSLPQRDQRLHLNLTGRNPDDGITAVPYDKGAAFLRRIEREVGREKFDAFLQRWFDSHAFRSVTTYEFLDYLDEELPEVAEVVDLDVWVSGPGLPDASVPAGVDAFERVDGARLAWLDGTPAAAIDTDGWATTHWLRFLSEMPLDLPAERVAALDAEFGLTASRNSEIIALWLLVAIRSDYRAADARLEEFLLQVGRRKFLQPLYEELAKSEAGRKRAIEIYERARPRYHAISRRTIDGILEWEW